MPNFPFPSRRLVTRGAAIAAGVAAAIAAPSLHRARGQATQPTAATADAVPADGRSFEEVDAEIRKTIPLLQGALSSPKALVDPDQRKALAPKTVPVLKKLVALFDELVRAKPEIKPQVIGQQDEYTIFLSLFGDQAATKRLAAMADDADSQLSMRGKAGQFTVAWVEAAQDADAQGKVADEVEKAAKAHPESEPLTARIDVMTQLGDASPDLSDRMKGLINDVMKNAVADGAKQQMEAVAKLAQLENKPLTITGKTVEGKDFTTADYRGKVVLVDFWATWCGPCKAALPRVKETYAKYHAQGLEIVGVSNDYAADDLIKFVAADKGMPWPQLFDPVAAAKGDWNSITAGFGIEGIPTMFLIDKKGVCRTVSADDNMDELIPKLLAEK